MVESAAVIVVAALALICLGDVVQAAMPADTATDCWSHMCSEAGGCGAPASPPALVPVVTQAVANVIVPPAPVVVRVAAGAPEKPRDSPAFQLAPRSPPAAS
jgi:hypothetical protein